MSQFCVLGMLKNVYKRLPCYQISISISLSNKKLIHLYSCIAVYITALPMHC